MVEIPIQNHQMELTTQAGHRPPPRLIEDCLNRPSKPRVYSNRSWLACFCGLSRCEAYFTLMIDRAVGAHISS
jgi:hypothetical protein